MISVGNEKDWNSLVTQIRRDRPTLFPYHYLGARLEKAIGGHNNYVFKVAFADELLCLKIFEGVFVDRIEREIAAADFLSQAEMKFTASMIFKPRNALREGYLLYEWIDDTADTYGGTAEDKMCSIIDFLAELHSLDCSAIKRKRHNYVQSRADMYRFLSEEIGRCAVREDDVLIDAFHRISPSRNELPESHLAFCKGDLSGANFLFKREAVVSVDWEYSGVGDTAYEIADFLSHPYYVGGGVFDTSRLVSRYLLRADVGGTEVEAWLERYHELKKMNFLWWALRLERDVMETRVNERRGFWYLPTSHLETQSTLLNVYHEIIDSVYW